MTLEFLLVSQASFVTSPFSAWMPFAIAGAVMVIGMLALIMMFSSMIGRPQIRTWMRIKIYDVLLTIFLIFVFFFVVSFLFSIDFSRIFNAIQLTPTECAPGGGANVDLISQAVCNMFVFNTNVQTLNSMVYYFALRLSFVPDVKISLGIPALPGLGGETKLTLSPAALDVFSGYLLDALYTAFVISQLQLLVLASALLLFSVFMAVGFISRIFVLTRTFGGAMIALALGLGIVYPLMVNITYGYVNVGIQNTLGPGCSATNLSSTCVAWMVSLLAGVPFVILGVLLTGIGVALPGFMQFFQFVGFVGMGLVIVPILNLLIVDVFVIDFSQAIGERMDFATLLGRLL